MKRSSSRHADAENATIIVSVAIILIAILLGLQLTTGVSFSIRGTAVYNTLPSYSEPMHKAAEASGEEEGTLKERLCNRVVRRFANDSTMWTRVNERILSRFGFACEK